MSFFSLYILSFAISKIRILSHELYLTKFGCNSFPSTHPLTFLKSVLDFKSQSQNFLLKLFPKLSSKTFLNDFLQQTFITKSFKICLQVSVFSLVLFLLDPIKKIKLQVSIYLTFSKIGSLKYSH